MLAQEVFELRARTVPPRQALLVDLQAESRDRKQLRSLLDGPRRLARCTAEVAEHPRLARSPPGAQRVVEFLLGAGPGHAGRRTEPAPHDSDEEVALPDLVQDQLLGPPHVRTRVSLPADDVEHEPCLRRDAAVEFVGDGLDVFTLGRDIAGRGNKDTQSFQHHRVGRHPHPPKLSLPTALQGADSRRTGLRPGDR